MTRLPPKLSPPRLAAGLVLPLAAYLVIRAVIGSATGALALTAPTGSFVADSTAARILVLGTGAVITAGFIRRLKLQRR